MTNRFLLINSHAPRPRTLADNMLENSLAFLKTSLEAEGFETIVWDKNRVSHDRSLQHRSITRSLRRAYEKYLGLKKDGQAADSSSELSKINDLQVELDKILDQRQDVYIQEILTEIREQNITIVGVKVWYGDAFAWTAKLVEQIHEHFPDVLVIGGGPHVNVHHSELFKYSKFDLLIYPEGEKACVEIARRFDYSAGRQAFLVNLKERPISNVTAALGEEPTICLASMKEKALPVYGNDKEGKILIHSIQEARGCDWNRCTFCSHPTIFEKFALRPPADLMAEIETCLKEGIGIFRFTASDTPVKVATSIAQQILSRQWTIIYSMFTRAVKNAENKVDLIATDFELLAKSGLRAVFIGAETGNDRINLEVMKKGVTHKDLIYTIRAIKKASANTGLPIDVVLSVIHPTPLLEGVTGEDVYNDTYNLIEQARPDSVIVCPPGVFPRTEWWRQPDKYGFQLSEHYHKDSIFYEYAMYKPPELWKIVDYHLNDLNMIDLLKQTSKLRAAVSALGIPSEVTDEYLIMARAAGISEANGLMHFKEQSLLDILSTDDTFTNEVFTALNTRSKALAAESLRRSEDLNATMQS